MPDVLDATLEGADTAQLSRRYDIAIAVLGVGFLGILVYLITRPKQVAAQLAAPAPSTPIYFAPIINTGEAAQTAAARAAPLPAPTLPQQLPDTRPGVFAAALTGAFHQPEVAPTPPESMPAPPDAKRPLSPPIMKTYVLPVLGTQPAVRIAQAIKAPYDVTLRVVGPAGEFGVFSMEASELNFFDTTSPAIPAGDTLIIPSGQYNTVRLAPHQILYGKGSSPNVSVSILAAEAGERLYT